MLSHEEQQKIMSGLLKRKENLHCAECGSKSPCWASLQFGVLVCLDCSGAHRALGPSVTRVKSTRLDTWSRDWLQCIEAGNDTVNDFWQHSLPPDNHSTKPNENSSVEFRIRFVRDKYIRQLYIHPDRPLEDFKKQALQQKVSQVKQPQRSSTPASSFPKNDLKQPTQKSQKEAVAVKQPKKAVVDFSFFDQMMKPKEEQKVKATNSHDLIGHEEKPKQSSRKPVPSFMDFDLLPPKPKEEKINKQQFMSMGGVPPSRTKPKAIDFDLFHQDVQKKQASSNLISFQNDQNKKAKADKNLFEDYGVGNPAKANFATMAGHNQHKIKMTSHATLGASPSFADSWAATGCLPSLDKTSVPKNDPSKGITLATTIDLSQQQKPPSQSSKSWVDEWK